MIHSKQYIYVKFQKEGVHKYPAALEDPNLEDVSFLGYPHRHMFHFKVKIEVFHDDRDLEFIQVKRQCERWLGEGTLELDYKSCEMIANDLFALINEKWPNRDVVIDVSEDNENGCEIEYLKSNIS